MNKEKFKNLASNMTVGQIKYYIQNEIGVFRIAKVSRNLFTVTCKRKDSEKLNIFSLISAENEYIITNRDDYVA